MTASKQEPKKTPFDDLVYATGRWQIYRQDAGMGEKDYCVLRNGDFFCRTEHEQLAKDICAAYDKIRSHSSAEPVAEPKHRTYESCRRRFACPDGEECWYLSADYYWDCGGGASRLSKAVAEAVKAEREQLRERYVEYMGHPCPELAEKYNHGCDAEYCGLCILDEVQESLRGGEP